ncbi:MAG TPA: hypothetical protein VEZ55_06895 [Chitinophagaceae bacterium]|nr:hypothetical protein [Chitinophagaceae bacterium]
MIEVPICFTCIHFIDDGKFTCKAFPKGIIEDILYGNSDHENPTPEQENNIVFEEAD